MKIVPLRVNCNANFVMFTSLRDRSRERSGRKERSRSRDTRRSRSHDRGRRRSHSPPALMPARNIEITATQHAQINQFLTASILTPPSTVHSVAQLVGIQPDTSLRTDFSNLFQSSSSTMQVPLSVPNSAALKIASEKAKNLLKAKNLTDTLKISSTGNSVASNCNDSSHDGKSLFQLFKKI